MTFDTLPSALVCVGAVRSVTVWLPAASKIRTCRPSPSANGTITLNPPSGSTSTGVRAFVFVLTTVTVSCGPAVPWVAVMRV